MSQLDDFVQAVLKGAGDLAVQTLNGFRDDAVSDAKDFLEETKDDLAAWGAALARGELSREEFADLVQGRLDLAKLAALTAAGVAEARLQQFRDGLIKVVTDAAVAAFL